MPVISNEEMRGVFENKKILITGNTGFIGAWLSLCLSYFGANVIGYSKRSSNGNRFSDKVNAYINARQYSGDITNKDLLEDVIISTNPDIVFHLAGQAFIGESYIYPFETIHPNVFGTLSLLEIVMRHNHPCKIIVLTGDKCYKLKGASSVYTEHDEIGGSSPYSTSKAMQEQLVSMYHNIFFSKPGSTVRCCTIRSGNIIGGGDFSASRLIPVIVRSIHNKEDIILYEPSSIRSWLYILDAVFGYLLIAKSLCESEHISGQSFNIGPDNMPVYTTLDVARSFLASCSASNKIIIEERMQTIDSREIFLVNEKIKEVIGWRCRVTTDEAITRTADWYNTYHENSNEIIEFSMKDISRFLYT